MIRFVDLTDFYWAFTRQEVAKDQSLKGCEPAPVCAFLGTVTNCFVRAKDGSHTFHSRDEIEQLGSYYAELVPDGFFDVRKA